MNTCLKTLLILCSFWLVSCGNNDKIPEGIISPVEMSGILLDMQMAKSYSNSYIPTDTPYRPENRQQRIKAFYTQILMLHHTDTLHFKKSFRFYKEHPDELKKIYSLILDSLEKKKKRHEAAMEKHLKVNELRSRLSADTTSILKKFLLFQHTLSDSIHHQSSRIFYPDLFD